MKKWSYTWKPKWKINEKIILNISNLWLDANHIMFGIENRGMQAVKDTWPNMIDAFVDWLKAFNHSIMNWDCTDPPILWSFQY